MSYNKLIMEGNLTKDPIMKQIGDKQVCEFGIAVNRKFTINGQSREEVCFIDCTSWGRTGESIAQYFCKGKPILVEGRLVYRTWEGSEGTKSKHEFAVERFTFVLKDSTSQSGGESRHDPANHNRNPEPPLEEPPF